ncbi:MAG: peptidoglycan editing factor PgeF [Sulfobacillus benefaciens]|uniref:Purine nucleoside phosphorylase n=1 Tax=Sulfobacillus benefaciens TaxID=453960 RepID=A0A2T2XFJ8_9FIRM|nr:MAG: peptidoglycan editing factor PgeF [Sulfobacillus benefaciens]
MQWHLDPGTTNWVWDTPTPVSAWVTTRSGGVSYPPLDSRNISFNVGDLASAVIENRRRSVPRLDQLIMAQQVHKAETVWVGPQDAGRGALDASSAILGADGLATDSEAVVLGMGFADCVPIFFTDVTGSAIGIVHAGWRGTVSGVQLGALESLQQHGWGPEEMLVGIGPAIGPCCYEVDVQVAEKVRLVLGGSDPLSAGRDSHHFYLDLWETNRLMLERAGVPSSQIAILRRCTACHPEEFFSHRRDRGRSGRMGGFICR